MSPVCPGSRLSHALVLRVVVVIVSFFTTMVISIDHDDAGAQHLGASVLARADEPRTPLSDALSGEAKTQYDIARILYRDGDWSGALVKFKRAYDLSHDARLLWNLAACEKNLRHYVRVLRHVEQYVREATLSKEELEKANTFSTAVRTLVGEVTIATTETGAQISVDGEAVPGATPFEGPILIDQGTRKLHVSKAGFRPLDRSIEVEGGGKQTVSIELEKEVGKVTVRARPTETIKIDERNVGQGSWTGALTVGSHVLVVTAASGKTRRADFVLGDKENREFALEVEGGGSPFPRWILWVGAGLLVAGAAVGGYFLFRPQPTPPPPGTIDAYQVP